MSRPARADRPDQGVPDADGPVRRRQGRQRAASLAGEFVAILGHSGCGKSTVLSIVAGLDSATFGGVIIDGTRGDRARRRARDRLPVAVPAAVADGATERAGWRRRRARRRRRRRRRASWRDYYLDIVGIGDCAMQMPGELSLGTQQCVSLARALVVEPRFLLLDEPFSQLDSLTRFELQDMLLRVWEAVGQDGGHGHPRRRRGALPRRPADPDDRRPRSHGRRRLHVPFPRPRNRAAVLAHPELSRRAPARDRLPRAPRPPVAPERARRRACQASRLTPGSPRQVGCTASHWRLNLSMKGGTRPANGARGGAAPPPSSSATKRSDVGKILRWRSRGGLRNG